jgi:hypothetical protein
MVVATSFESGCVEALVGCPKQQSGGAALQKGLDLGHPVGTGLSTTAFLLREG